MRKFLAAIICAAMLASVSVASITVQADTISVDKTAKAVTSIQPSGVSELRVKSNSEYVYGLVNPDSDDSYALVLNYIGNSEKITLPTEIEGLNVNGAFIVGMTVIQTSEVDYTSSELSDPFSGNTKIKEVVIPETIESVRGNNKGAFSSCPNLTKVVIMNSDMEIGEHSFEDCSKLTIYGKKGSTAERYALEKNIPFAEIGSDAGVSTEETKTVETIPNTPISSDAPDFSSYFNNEVIGKNGTADKSDKTQTITTDNIYDERWSQRTGVIGYDVADFNDDGKDEMLVYSVDEHKVYVTSYVADENGNISQADSIVVHEEGNGAASYCTVRIVELNGKKFVYVERFNNSTYFSNGSYVSYDFYEIRSNKKNSIFQENGDILIKYHVGMNGAASYPITYYLEDYGDYAKVEWGNGKGEVSSKEIFNEETSNGSTDKQYIALRSALAELGMPETDNTVSNVLKSLGYQNYENTVMGKYPSYYFNSSNSMTFTLVNAPTDITASSQTLFKSILKTYNSSSAAGIGGNTTNTTNTSSNTSSTNSVANTSSTSGNTSSDIKSPKTGVVTDYGAMLMVLLTSGVAVVLTGKKHREND